jgi:hypothetical protein
MFLTSHPEFKTILKLVLPFCPGATSSSPAKLVYYDSEQKHRAKNPPRREIVLEKCFNINRKQDYQVTLLGSAMFFLRHWLGLFIVGHK